MARFAKFASVAAEEALQDAGWHPQSKPDQEATVSAFMTTSRPAVLKLTLFRASVSGLESVAWRRSTRLP